ncbi:hypothetical protein EPN18_02125 [bacterium]|nr:MAG: hypothetical protein EPN18_02125 [bacterium]
MNTANRKIISLKNAAVAGALLFFVVLSSAISFNKSNTWDEPAHILAGYAYLKDGQDYISPLHHPAFGRLLTGLLPAVALSLDFKTDVLPEQAAGSNFFPYSLKFLFENKVSGHKILYLSRLAIILTGALLGFYVYLWSSELWGVKSGFLSLFLYVLSPSILGHTSLATTDMPITAFFFITLFYSYRVAVAGASLKTVIPAALFYTLALTSKHTALLAAPLICAAFTISAYKEKSKAIKAIAYFALFAVLVYIGIWAVYSFRFKSDGPHYVPLFWDQVLSGGGVKASIIAWVKQARLLPEAYLYSLAGVISGSESGRAAFLMGMYSTAGWWYYFITAYLVKTPVAEIVLFSAAIVYSFSNRADRAKALWLFAPVALIFIVMSKQNVNIGLRHVMPAFPFILALAGYCAKIKTASMKIARYVFYFLLVWYVYAAVSIYPHQLSYFNEIAGGSKNGHMLLADSNVDWGQDLIGLKKYMDDKKIDTIKFAYFGFSNPKYYGIKYEYLPSIVIMDIEGVKRAENLKGYVAVSATMLSGVYSPNNDFSNFFRKQTPVDIVGNSILIYKF